MRPASVLTLSQTGRPDFECRLLILCSFGGRVEGQCFARAGRAVAPYGDGRHRESGADLVMASKWEGRFVSVPCDGDVAGGAFQREHAVAGVGGRRVVWHGNADGEGAVVAVPEPDLCGDVGG